MGQINSDKAFVEEFEKLPKEEKLRQLNEVYTKEDIDLLYDNGYNFPVNDGKISDVIKDSDIEMDKETMVS